MERRGDREGHRLAPFRLRHADRALDRHAGLLDDPLRVAAAFGGRELAAILGATLAARRQNIPVLLDGAQAVPHVKVDVRELDCDFYVFSGHKLYGPTGIGVLYGKAALLEAMPPWQGGGDMIRSVTFEKTTYNVLPYKFEAGTPDMAGAIGLGTSIDYVSALCLEAIA